MDSQAKSNSTIPASIIAQLSLLAFCGGIIALRFFETLPPIWLTFTVTALLVLLFARIRWGWLCPLAALALGIFWATFVATELVNTALPKAIEKKNVTVIGKVVSVPKVGDRYQRFDFLITQLEWKGVLYPSPGKVRMTHYGAQPKIRSGQRWQFTARLKHARSQQNPGARFNYETYLFHHRIRATGYVRAKPNPILLASHTAYSLTVFRARVASFIRTQFESDTPSPSHSGLVSALVVGVRNDMQPRDWDVLLATGTIHLLAISGLHIGLVSWLVWLLSSCVWRFAGRLPLLMPASSFGVLAGVVAGLVYALLAGMTIPTQRALCMLVVIAVALFFKRRVFSGETLLLALVVVLAFDPLAPLADGLWLSFGAVVILVIGVARTQMLHSSKLSANSISNLSPDIMDSAITKTREILQKLMIGVTVQGVLFIGMLPLLLVLFHQFSLVAPLANLVAIPVIGLIVVPLGLIGLLLYSLGLESAATVAFYGALWVIDWLWVLLEWLAAVDWSVWQQASPPLWSLPLAVVGVIVLLSPKAFPARWSGVFWLLPLFSTPNDVLNTGEFKYSMLEVGHGLASVVQTRDHVLVYDTGPRFAPGMDAGQMFVVPFLQHSGIVDVDTLVVSHGDNDHIGGHRSVLDRFRAKQIFTSIPDTDEIPTSKKCRAGQGWVWDEVRFEMLAPSPSAQRGNESSCVLKISSEFGSVLLTGDIGKATERWLVESGEGDDLAADILQVPHHGSKTSSTHAFLNEVKPTVALASIGYLNRYNHPHKTVSDRYARANIPVYYTAEEGAIIASFTAHGIDLHGYRSVNQKYWLQPAKQLLSTINFASVHRAKPILQSDINVVGD